MPIDAWGIIINVTNGNMSLMDVPLVVFRESSNLGFFFDGILLFVFLAMVQLKTQNIGSTVVAAIVLGSGMIALNMLPVSIVWLLRIFVVIAVAGVFMVVYRSNRYG